MAGGLSGVPLCPPLFILIALYASLPTSKFGPVSLKAVREKMVAAGTLARKTVNTRINCIRQIFRWGVENELVPETVWRSLTAVAPLKVGRTSAWETDEVTPIDREIVEKTLQFMPPMIADMVKIQLGCGMRPQDVCNICLTRQRKDDGDLRRSGRQESRHRRRSDRLNKKSRWKCCHKSPAPWRTTHSLPPLLHRFYRFCRKMQHRRRLLTKKHRFLIHKKVCLRDNVNKIWLAMSATIRYTMWIQLNRTHNTTMRKLKLYLDTSVISHIDAPHKPVEEAATQKFYQYIIEHADEYELLFSPIVDAEVNDCPEPKRAKLLKLLEKLKGSYLHESDEVLNLVENYIENGVLGSQHWRDLTHIAYATIADCDYILSWNFKHFVNVRTVHRVNMVNVANNYRLVTIVSPSFITGENLNAEV